MDLARATAEARDAVILAPRFGLRSGFQWLGLWMPGRAAGAVPPTARFDLLLLAMVTAVGQRFSVATTQFDLFGYSAGGQFAHRFLYLHPERLLAVAIGAPGMVTMPSVAAPWPSGLAGVNALAGHPVDLGPVHGPRILLFVGAEDTAGETPPQTVEEQALVAESNCFGRNRVERARALHSAWLKAGIAHDYVEVPGMGHGGDMSAGLASVQRFFVDD